MIGKEDIYIGCEFQTFDIDRDDLGVCVLESYGEDAYLVVDIFWANGARNSLSKEISRANLIENFNISKRRLSRNRHIRSVVDVSKDIHMYAKGTYECQAQEIALLVDWLRWRVEDGWEIFPLRCERNIVCSIEDAIRDLARNVLKSYDSMGPRDA